MNFERSRRVKDLCSKEFFMFCHSHYKTMMKKERADYRKLFFYIAFGTFFKNGTTIEDGSLRIPHRLLAKFSGIDLNIDNNHWKSLDFLEDFRRDVLPKLEWTDYEYAATSDHGECSYFGKCRHVKSAGFDQQTIAAIKQELLIIDNQEVRKYHFDSGNAYCIHVNAAKIRSKYQEWLDLQQYWNLNPTQKMILDTIMISGVNTQAFVKKSEENAELIENAISKMIPQIDQKIPLAQLQDNQRKLIASIKEDGRVYYQPSRLGNTARLYSWGDSALGLKRTVRKALCHGYYEADLESSQFIILSAFLQHVAGDKELECTRLIKSKMSLWTFLNSQITGNLIPPASDQKKAWKQFIYAMAFGMGISALKAYCRNNNCEKLLEISMLKEMLCVRKAVFDWIERQGYIEDVWGKKHYISPAGSYKDIYGHEEVRKERWHGALLGTYIQSIELEIISGAILFVADHKSAPCRIRLWLHDGFVMSISNPKKIDWIIEGVKKGVKDKAAEVSKKLGYDLTNMRLEIEQL